MHNCLYLHSTWIIGTLLDVAILGVFLYRRRRLREWPSIFTYIILSLACDAFMRFGHPTYRHYFYTYWTWYSVAAALRFCILYDVLRSFPGSAFIRARLGYAALFVGLGAAAASLWIASFDHNHVTTFAITFDTAILIGWGAFIAGAMVCVKFMGLIWDTRGALVTNGVAVKAVAGVLAAHLLIHSPQARIHGTHMLATAAVVNLGFWLVGLIRANGFHMHAANPFSAPLPPQRKTVQ